MEVLSLLQKYISRQDSIINSNFELEYKIKSITNVKRKFTTYLAEPEINLISVKTLDISIVKFLYFLNFFFKLIYFHIFKPKKH